MKIVVTDGVTLNPGDLSWEQLADLGNCDIYDNSTPEENLQRCRDADIVLTNKVVFDKDTLEQLPSLKLISVTATGYNIIDTTTASQRNVVVTNVPAYSTQSVAQMTFALILELCQHVGHHSQTVHEGRWSRSPNFCYWDKPLIELAGRTLGIVGTGRIGSESAQIAKAFGMNVIATNRTGNPGDTGLTIVDRDELFARSDIVSLHCPLTNDNEQFVNQTLLTTMKPSAFLINTSRGQLINEQHLADALNSEQIAGAGLDVLATEPPAPDNPLLTAKNCVITPHIAWATRAARSRLMDIAVDNVKAFLQGSPRNVVNPA
ncbi:D-2-hydroxyacid dehydrogenase [Mucisphaera calidilacus]|uniref:2-hydroxyacid dehydrogenase n=1 Tax=Mucisphaera calidilacus TaxID=2527982 RepID=A0A518BWL4_9BACT|nr:D-2-hydroxyacid dehydrogenase [Mucisphaera calidilacus]QDU71361.1 Putative 2-hydroxyacid dehydrogenase [Mucisphaera calidilacus]